MRIGLEIENLETWYVHGLLNNEIEGTYLCSGKEDRWRREECRQGFKGHAYFKVVGNKHCHLCAIGKKKLSLHKALGVI